MPPAHFTFTVYTDGASRSNPGPAACAYVITGDPAAAPITHKQYLGPRVTNNVAEYQGMLMALTRLVELAASLGHPPLVFVSVHSDSQLVVQQIKGDWKVRDADLKAICAQCQQRIRALRDRGWQVDVRWTRREDNRVADHLCNQALNEAALSPELVAL